MTKPFRSGNRELESLVQEATLPRLLAYFEARTLEWPQPVKHLECFSVSLFFDLGAAFQNGKAFELLEIAAQLPWDQFADSRFLLGVDLLAELATASGTSEVPPGLAEAWPTLASRIRQLDPSYLAWMQVKRQYRYNEG